MSDAGGYERLTVDSDGVRVTKRFERDEFPVPAIAFEFESERDRAVSVRLEDRVPEGVAVEDLGFHPEYGSEHWTVEEETIAFERELPADAEYTTVYGIRATGTEEIERFLTEPTIASVDPPLGGANTEPADDVVPESDEVVRDVISSGGEVPGLGEENDATDPDEGAADEEVATLELRDPNEADPDNGDDAPRGPTAAANADRAATTMDEPGADGDGPDAVGESVSAVTGDETSGPGPADDPTTSGSRDRVLVSALAAEIRSGEVPVEDLELIGEALDRVGAAGTTEARIGKLQSDIADLRAYTDALETFLDENGTADRVIEEFEDRLDAFGEELSTLETELETNRTETEELANSVESVRSGVDDLSGDLDGVRRDVSSVESVVDDLEDTVEDLGDDIDRLETEGDVSERLDEIESDLTELREWQEQIKQTFGG
jgi:predicted  nucleic acid-binding Zn-ribbon protein